MVYKSSCRACSHPHDGMICTHVIHKIGTIRLRSFNSSLWGINGGYVKNYDYSQQGDNLSFKAFDTAREESFEYNQETDCGCRCYIPSDNLEFLEWKYDESNNK